MNGDIIKKTAPNKMKIGIAIIFSMIGVSGSFRLIAGDSSGIGLLTVTLVSLCGLLIIFFGDSVDWFDLKNLKVQMRKVEESKKEIEELAYLTVQMAVLSHQGAVILGGKKTGTRRVDLHGGMRKRGGSLPITFLQKKTPALRCTLMLFPDTLRTAAI